MPNELNKVYDLEERTAVFGERALDFVKRIPRNDISGPLIRQLVKSATSIGANYCEADCAETKKDFIHKIGISKKESRETRYWLRMIGRAVPALKEEIMPLMQEARELNFIFIAIIKKAKSKD